MLLLHLQLLPLLMFEQPMLLHLEMLEQLPLLLQCHGSIGVAVLPGAGATGGGARVHAAVIGADGLGEA